MSTLRKQDPIGLGTRQLACSSIEQAIRCLTRQPGKATIAIRAIRTSQAMLALLEPDLPRAVLRRDRAILGRVTDGLSEMTRPAMLLARLEARYKKSPSDATLASTIKTLRKQWAGQTKPGMAMSSKAGTFNPAIYRIVADMAELRGYAETWPIEAIDKDALPRGLRRTYTRARRLANQPTTAMALDELITCLGLLDSQLQAISKAAPPMIKAHRKLLSRAIAGYTTVHQDALLDKAINQQLGKRPPTKTIDIRKRADTPAIDLTQALAESPAAFASRLSVYWSVWRRVAE